MRDGVDDAPARLLSVLTSQRRRTTPPDTPTAAGGGEAARLKSAEIPRPWMTTRLETAWDGSGFHADMHQMAARMATGMTQDWGMFAECRLVRVVVLGACPDDDCLLHHRHVSTHVVAAACAPAKPVAQAPRLWVR
jgi:hypothetical protein